MEVTDRSATSDRGVGPTKGRSLALLVALLTLAGCSDTDGSPSGPGGTVGTSLESCDLNTNFVADGGVGRDGIPALTDPPMATPDGSGTFDYLDDGDRVVGFLVDGQAYAVPHNILWFHEIANLNLDGGQQLAITLCPLTGTSLGFDRSSIDGDELGVSGLLFKANLIMYNRSEQESLWPQMLAEARCGADVGKELERFPVVETTWGGWKALHPGTRAVTAEANPQRSYRSETYPYGENYESPSNPSFLGFPMPQLDSRRPPKERVIGVPPGGDDAAVAFPFGLLSDAEGSVAVVEFTRGGEPAVVLWSDAAEGGMVYRPRTGEGREVELTADGDAIRDAATGSRWSVDGRAVSGEQQGASLEPVASAYTAFWGAWAAFFPETELWEG